jgi:Multicopper oxidase
VVAAFDANNPGWWALHCHLLYHLEAGMFTTIKYVTPRERFRIFVWVFLAVAVSLQKTPIMRVGFSWISLDSLVRIQTYQWVTKDFPRKIFPRAFFRVWMPRMDVLGL